MLSKHNSQMASGPNALPSSPPFVEREEDIPPIRHVPITPISSLIAAVRWPLTTGFLGDYGIGVIGDVPNTPEYLPGTDAALATSITGRCEGEKREFDNSNIFRKLHISCIPQPCGDVAVEELPPANSPQGGGIQEIKSHIPNNNSTFIRDALIVDENTAVPAGDAPLAGGYAFPTTKSWSGMPLPSGDASSGGNNGNNSGLGKSKSTDSETLSPLRYCDDFPEYTPISSEKFTKVDTTDLDLGVVSELRQEFPKAVLGTEEVDSKVGASHSESEVGGGNSTRVLLTPNKSLELFGVVLPGCQVPEQVQKIEEKTIGEKTGLAVSLNNPALRGDKPKDRSEGETHKVPPQGGQKSGGPLRGSVPQLGPAAAGPQQHPLLTSILPPTGSEPHKLAQDGVETINIANCESVSPRAARSSDRMIEEDRVKSSPGIAKFFHNEPVPKGNLADPSSLPPGESKPQEGKTGGTMTDSSRRQIRETADFRQNQPEASRANIAPQSAGLEASQADSLIADTPPT